MKQFQAPLRRAALILTSAVVLALLGSCGLFPVHLTPDTYTASDNVFFHDLDDVKPGRTISYQIDVGPSPHDVYLVFTNPTYGSIDAPTLDASVAPIETPRGATSVTTRSLEASGIAAGPRGLRDNPDLAGWEPAAPGASASRGVAPPPSFAAVPAPDQYNSAATTGGTEYREYDAATYTDSWDFYYDSTASGQEIPAVLAKRVAGVSTPFGAKTLEIWVQKTEWKDAYPVTGEITPTMVSELANTFLAAGADNDIYDWVTTIYGEEWNDTLASVYSNLIDGHDTITILLYNIAPDGYAGGVVGFFWSKDNFTLSQYSYSNERVMFYVDSESFATADGAPATWDITDSWPNDIVSTLAHEFQHMINFHQAYIVHNVSMPTWMNEMMSLVTEDLVEWRRGGEGPRGVDPLTYSDGSAGPTSNQAGRIPGYNLLNDISLTSWNWTGDALDSYSIAYAFGAYIARNFGGANLMAAMMNASSSAVDTILSDAVNSASGTAGMTMEQLLWRWGSSVLLSDGTQIWPYQLNPDAWMSSTIGGSATYKLGSIDHYRYSPAPYVESGSVDTTKMPPGSTRFHLVGSGLTGTVAISLQADAGMDFAVVVK